MGKKKSRIGADLKEFSADMFGPVVSGYQILLELLGVPAVVLGACLWLVYSAHWPAGAVFLLGSAAASTWPTGRAYVLWRRMRERAREVTETNATASRKAQERTTALQKNLEAAVAAREEAELIHGVDKEMRRHAEADLDHANAELEKLRRDPQVLCNQFKAQLHSLIDIADVLGASGYTTTQEQAEQFVKLLKSTAAAALAPAGSGALYRFKSDMTKAAMHPGTSVAYANPNNWHLLVTSYRGALNRLERDVTPADMRLDATPPSLPRGPSGGAPLP